VAVRSNQKRGDRRRRGNTAGMILLGCSIIGAAVILRGESGTPAPQSSPRAQTVVAEFDVVRVPVPRDFVPAGTKLADVQFVDVNFPKHQVPIDAIIDLDSVRDQVALSALPANLPLFRANLSSSGNVNNPVVERIPPGMRAMTIKVDATSSVEGWARSGDWVDVLLMEKDRTTVVAERVKILSAERSVSPVAGTGSPNVPSTITLLVTQEQCLAINTAIPRGRIAFALRSVKDEKNWDDTVYTADRLRSGANGESGSQSITGYISVDGKRSFALSDGKWIPTEVIPEGFLAARER
jgi:pilus assembly protein CpaB